MTVPVAEDFSEIAKRMREIDGERPCFNCSGRGWIEIGDSYPAAWDACPQCKNRHGREKPA